MVSQCPNFLGERVIIILLIIAQPWRTITDTLACYKIFLILNSYSNGYTNRTEAKEQLSSCDLSQLDSFIPHIQESVRQLLEKPEDTI
mgnify:CR=1 FL=1